jgi:hypothetical protein
MKMNADAEAVRYRNKKTQSSHGMLPYRNKLMSNWERDVSTILFTMVLSGPKQGFFPQTTQLLYIFCTFRPEKRFFCSYYQKPYGLKPSTRVADPDPYPDSIGSVDPDPDLESGSGSRRAKMTHKSRKSSCFEVLDGLF